MYLFILIIILYKRVHVFVISPFSFPLTMISDAGDRVGEGNKRELWESELQRELEEQRTAAKQSVHSGLAHIRSMSRDAQRFRASKGLTSKPD